VQDGAKLVFLLACLGRVSTVRYRYKGLGGLAILGLRVVDRHPIEGSRCSLRVTF
jgi:hypothetical protein